MRFLLALILVGCGPDPLNNDPARLVEFNGARMIGLSPDLPPPYTPGEDYPIDMVFEDPEGDPFEVSFPWPAPGWAVNERTGDGVLRVWPDDPLQGIMIAWVTVDGRGARGGGFAWIPPNYDLVDTGDF